KEQVNSILKLKLSRFNLKSVDDIFANVGAGDIGVNIIIGIISANIEKNKDEVVDSNELIEDLINKRQNDELLKKNKTKSGIIVEGVGDIMTHMAKCCQPIPGDEIVGFVTQGRGISIHRCDCEKFRRMQELFPERVVDATWGSNVNIDSGYTVTVRIVSEDYSGFLRDITTVIANEKMNVLGIKSHVDSAKNVCLVDVDLLVVSIPVLNRTLAKLNDLTRVISAQRV
ncbi:MAG: ACT domain-containing protein, partial [Succinivibrio dextrinosolvens]|nr:ACT domain-containing protein [Succinivibrio dextrinosolvens]